MNIINKGKLSRTVKDLKTFNLILPRDSPMNFLAQ